MKNKDTENKIFHISGNYQDLIILNSDEKNLYYPLYNSLNKRNKELNSIVYDWRRSFFLHNSKLKPFCPLSLKSVDFELMLSYLKRYYFLKGNKASDEFLKNIHHKMPSSEKNKAAYKLMTLFWQGAKINRYAQGNYTGSSVVGQIASRMKHFIIEHERPASLNKDIQFFQRFMYLGDNNHAYGFTLEYLSDDPYFWAIGVTKHPKNQSEQKHFDYFFSPAFHTHSHFEDFKKHMRKSTNLGLKYLNKSEYDRCIKARINSSHCFNLYKKQMEKTIRSVPLESYLFGIYIACLIIHTTLFLLACNHIGDWYKKLPSNPMMHWLPIIVVSTLIIIALLILAIYDGRRLKQLDGTNKGELKKRLIDPYAKKNHPSATLRLTTAAAILSILAFIIFGVVIVTNGKLFSSLSVADGVGIIATTTMFAIVGLLTFYNYQCQNTYEKGPYRINDDKVNESKTLEML